MPVSTKRRKQACSHQQMSLCNVAKIFIKKKGSHQNLSNDLATPLSKALVECETKLVRQKEHCYDTVDNSFSSSYFVY